MAIVARKLYKSGDDSKPGPGVPHRLLGVGARGVGVEATNFRAPISNFLEKTSREVEKKGVPRWDEGARKPRGNHAELD